MMFTFAKIPAMMIWWSMAITTIVVLGVGLVVMVRGAINQMKRQKEEKK